MHFHIANQLRYADFGASSAVPTHAPHSFVRTLIWIGIWPLVALQPSTLTLTPKTSLPEASCRNRPRNTSTFAEAELLPESRQLDEKNGLIGSVTRRVRGGDLVDR